MFHFNTKILRRTQKKFRVNLENHKQKFLLTISHLEAFNRTNLCAT